MTETTTDLSTRLDGAVATRDERGYASRTLPMNAAFEHAPDVVVHAADESDVVETVRFARAAGLPVHVHVTGHGAHAPVTSGILLDLSGMSSVSVDPATRTATVGGGTSWSEVVAAAAPYGLAPVTGSSTHVGVVGFLVGGGLGPLARAYGLGSDHVLAARVVTGSGAVVEASADGDEDLLWALRGGKTGLGVVTEVTLALMEVPALYAGTLIFDLAASTAPYARWLEWTPQAPDDLTTAGMVIGLPDLEMIPPPLRGKDLFMLHAAVPAGAEEGERLTAPLRALGDVYLDDLGPMELSDVARISNDPTERAPGFVRGASLERVDGDLADTVLALAGPGRQLPIMGIEVRHLGGAVAVETPQTSASGHRDLAYTLSFLGAPDPALFGEVLPGVWATVLERLAPWLSPHLTPNWMSDPHDPDQIAATWPAETLARLEAIRATHDPDGVLAG